MRPFERFRVSSRGAALACVRFGRGQPLLCAHALAFSKEHFAAAAGVLGAAFECVAVDQRGHGETDVDDGEDAFAAETMAEDLRAVLDHVGWDSALLGGTSLGAATTLLLALRHPGRVRMLIQDLPGYGAHSSHDSRAADHVAEALDAGDLDEAARRASRSLPPTRARALARTLLAQWEPFDSRSLGPKLASIFRASATWNLGPRWLEDLATLAIPTHVLGLAGDPLHPFPIAQTMARTIPRARLWPRVPSLDPEAMARQWIRVATMPI